MEPIIISIISGVVFYLVYRLWSRDRSALRTMAAALDVVKQQRDEAIENGKRAYAQGNADGRQLEREQIARERTISQRKRQIAQGDAQSRLN